MARLDDGDPVRSSGVDGLGEGAAELDDVLPRGFKDIHDLLAVTSDIQPAARVIHRNTWFAFSKGPGWRVRPRPRRVPHPTRIKLINHSLPLIDDIHMTTAAVHGNRTNRTKTAGDRGGHD